GSRHPVLLPETQHPEGTARAAGSSPGLVAEYALFGLLAGWYPRPPGPPVRTTAPEPRPPRRVLRRRRGSQSAPTRR
ncbi:MAG: hypothetical protein ABEL76_06655, partial [Bradymonadaceae bacterium]